MRNRGWTTPSDISANAYLPPSNRYRGPRPQPGPAPVLAPRRLPEVQAGGQSGGHPCAGNGGRTPVGVRGYEPVRRAAPLLGSGRGSGARAARCGGGPGPTRAPGARGKNGGREGDRKSPRRAAGRGPRGGGAPCYPRPASPRRRRRESLGEASRLACRARPGPARRAPSRPTGRQSGGPETPTGGRSSGAEETGPGRPGRAPRAALARLGSLGGPNVVAGGGGFAGGRREPEGAGPYKYFGGVERPTVSSPRSSARTDGPEEFPRRRVPGPRPFPAPRPDRSPGPIWERSGSPGPTLHRCDDAGI